MVFSHTFGILCYSTTTTHNFFSVVHTNTYIAPKYLKIVPRMVSLREAGRWSLVAFFNLFVTLPLTILRSYTLQFLFQACVRISLMLWVVLAVLVCAKNNVQEVRMNMSTKLLASEMISTSSIAMEIVYIAVQVAMALMIDDFVGNLIRWFNVPGPPLPPSTTSRQQSSPSPPSSSPSSPPSSAHGGGNGEEDDRRHPQPPPPPPQQLSSNHKEGGGGGSYGRLVQFATPYIPSRNSILYFLGFFFQLNDVKTHETWILVVICSSLSLFTGCILGQNSESISSFFVTVLRVSTAFESMVDGGEL